MSYQPPRAPKCGWGKFDPVVQQLANATLELPNKIAWQSISEGLVRERVPGLTNRQRNYLAMSVWLVRQRLRFAPKPTASASA